MRDLLSTLFHAPRRLLARWLAVERVYWRERARWRRAPGLCHGCGDACPLGERKCEECYSADAW